MTWDIVSEDVRQDLTQSIEEPRKKTVASINVASMISKRQKAVEIMNEELSLDKVMNVYVK